MKGRFFLDNELIHIAEQDEIFDDTVPLVVSLTALNQFVTFCRISASSENFKYES